MAKDVNSNSVENHGDSAAAENQALSELKAKVTGDSKISKYDIDQVLLIKFLRSRNGDVKAAFTLIKKYIAMIRSRPEIFSWSDDIKTVIESGLYFQYQHKTPNGERIIVVQVGKWDPSKTKFEDIIRASVFVEELLLMDEDVQNNGLIVLLDVHGVTLYQIYQMGISNSMLLSQLTDQCMPIKIVNVHVCFQNRLTDMLYSMFRPFLSEELKRRIVFQGQLGNLSEMIPPSNLPPLFNGTNDEPDLETAYANVEKHRAAIEKIWQQFKEAQ